MKALLFERNDHRENPDQVFGAPKSAIVVMPSGKLEPAPGELENVLIQFNDDGVLNVEVLLLGKPSEQFQLVGREIELGAHLLIYAMEYKITKDDYELAQTEDEKVEAEYEFQKAKMEFEEMLSQERVGSGICTAMLFLQLGSLVL